MYKACKEGAAAVASPISCDIKPRHEYQNEEWMQCPKVCWFNMAHTRAHTRFRCVYPTVWCVAWTGNRSLHTSGMPDPLEPVEPTARRYFSHVAHINVTSPQTHPWSRSCTEVTFIGQSSVNMPPWKERGGHVWRCGKVQIYGTRTCNHDWRRPEVTWAKKESVTEWQLPHVSVFLNHCCVTLAHCELITTVCS